MSRSLRRQWWSSLQSFRRRARPRRGASTVQYSRPLRLEPLEARWLLSITVNTLADENDGVGVGGISLRDAIAAAASGDTINFDATLTNSGPASILLTHGELAITKDLTINGPGADLLTIDASGNDSTLHDILGDGSRVFYVDDGNFTADKSISISGLTLTGGDAGVGGGAILSRENLTLTSSTISGNFSSGNGGGIYQGAGNLTVIGSTVSGNTIAGYGSGGGIFTASSFGSTLTVTDSTINNNSARGTGGGISSLNGYMTVSGSTISGNSSTNRGGGLYHSGINLSVSGSTITYNHALYGYGGGIFNSGGAATIDNSAVNHNSAGGYGGGIYAGFNSTITITNSTVSGNTSSRAGGGIASYADTAIIGSNINNNTSSGYAGGIGVLRHNLTLTNSVVSGNSAGNSGGGILFRNYGNTMTISGSTISYNASNFGSGGGISARRGTTNIDNSTISGNSAFFGTGGGIYGASGDLSLDKVNIRNNFASGNGGGIFHRYNNLNIANSWISSNVGVQGGGIYNVGYGTATITGSVVSGNSASSNGGGIASRNGNLSVSGSSIANNSAPVGAGVYSRGSGNVAIDGSTISGNSATTGNGGGLFVRDAQFVTTNSTISGNHASGSGGGMYLFGPAATTFTVRHSTIATNTVDGFGGGITVVGATLALDSTVVASNTAPFGPDLTSLFGVVHARYSLIGNNAGSGLATTPLGIPDADGNLIGPLLSAEPLVVSIDMAAMGDFEAGPGGDNFRFEYSVDGGPFQPLFTIDVDESASQTYFMDRGTQVVLADPLIVNGFYLNRFFQTFTAVIPDPGKQIRIRFTATNDGPSEAFAWRNLRINGQNSNSFVGSAVQFDASGDSFASFVADPDYSVTGDMFGIRSRLNPGVPSLPFDIVDDSFSTFPGDMLGIISQFDSGRFFGVVDTVNGVGSDTDSATWTFNNIVSPIDPKLTSLVDNAGPLLPDGSHLQSLALLPGSPAINAGDPAAVAGVGTVPEFDERGREPFGRVADGRIDMGAVELRSLHLVVDTLVDENDGDYSLGDFSLREAIDLANSNVGSGDTISFDSSLASGTILLQHGDLAITDGVTITGLGSQLLTVNARGNDSTPYFNDGLGSNVFTIAAASDVRISGLTLTGADSSSGGAIRNFTNLTLSDSIITGNSSRFSGGGGIYSTGTLTVINSQITGNTTTYGGGGGIFERYGSLTVIGSKIASNTSASDGGGIYMRYGTATVTDSTISYNSTASGRGGGIGARGGSLTFTGSTIRNNIAFNSGGGISDYFGSLNVASSTITGNTSSHGGGGGIFSTSGVDLTNSHIDNNYSTSNGGGISGRVVNVLRSTISNNRAVGNGGGIYCSYLLSVVDSTISFNTTVGTGHSGGGIALATAYLGTGTIVNSTITGNSSALFGGGVYWDGNGPSITIRHSTINGNFARFGGGVFVPAGTLHLDSTIVAQNNVQTAGADITGIVGFSLDARYSLIGSAAGTGLAEAPVGTPDAQGNLIGGPVHGLIDPLLGPLVDNAGLTPTEALLAFSPAINAGDPAALAGVDTVPANDQRGAPFTRVYGGRIDIGAYERQTLPGSSFVVDTLVDENDGDYGPGDRSLREVISLATGSVGTGEEIKFAPELTAGGPATILLTHGSLMINDGLKITGPGANRLTIDAAGNDPTPHETHFDGSSVFQITGGPVTIFGLTLTGADAQYSGGAIYSLANLTLVSSTITGNSARYSGGGIAMRGTNLTVNDSAITNNSANYSGGGIWNRNGILIVTGSKISGNSAQTGAGIYTGGYGTPSITNLTNTTVSGNSASFRGGGVANFRGNLNLSGSTISGNSAALDGAGIWSYTNLTNLLTSVILSTISGNTAARAGGGIANYRGRVDIRFSTITLNDAGPTYGSGLASSGNSSTRTQLVSTIVAGNLHSDVDLVFGATNSFFSSGFNLIGVGNAMNRFSTGGDQRGILDPKLGPLADHGGLTFTHSPLPGSTAIDAGSSAALPGVGSTPLYDQRGAPFIRVFDGDGAGGARIDVGALELQPISPAVFGDYNNDGFVDSADYSVYMDLLGTPTAAADGNANGIVDAADYLVWKNHFGFVVPSPGGGGGGESTSGGGAEVFAVSTATSIELESLLVSLPAVPSIAQPAAALFQSVDTQPTSAGTELSTVLAPSSASAKVIANRAGIAQDPDGPFRGVYPTGCSTRRMAGNPD